MGKRKQNTNPIELLNLYYDEWKYRLDRFRKQMTQSFIVIFFVITLPISIRFFNNIKIPDAIPLLLFPLSGVCLSFIFLFYCLSESSRITTLKNKIKLIINDNFPEKYHKYQYLQYDTKHFSFFKISMKIWIPIGLTIVEIIISAIMVYLITNKAIK